MTGIVVPLGDLKTDLNNVWLSYTDTSKPNIIFSRTDLETGEKNFNYFYFIFGRMELMFYICIEPLKQRQC